MGFNPDRSALALYDLFIPLERGGTVRRLIMHLDMDAYFASVEQQLDPGLRGEPIGVTGRPTEKSIIVAASREAKKYGLKAGMPVWEARRLCPCLVLVPGRAERYLSTTKKFLAILERYTPMIEVFSVDEVFMDVTQEAPRHDGPIPMAREIKADFREALGEYVTATIGIASGKAFAKLIGSRHKPDGIGYLDDEEIPELLVETPVGELCGIGHRIEPRLARAGIRTLAELGKASEAYLKREFGAYGLFLKAVGEGHDPNPVIPYTEAAAVKSVGHSRTLRPDLRDVESAYRVLRDLCDQVARRLRRLGYVGRTVHAWFRTTAESEYHGKQVTLATPTDDRDSIYHACLSAFRRIPASPREVSQIGVAVRNLMEKAGLPGPLLREDQRRERLNQAIDRIRDRFGEFAIRTGESLLYDPIPQHVSGFTLSNEEWEF